MKYSTVAMAARRLFYTLFVSRRYFTAIRAIIIALHAAAGYMAFAIIAPFVSHVLYSIHITHWGSGVVIVCAARRPRQGTVQTERARWAAIIAGSFFAFLLWMKWFFVYSTIMFVYNM